MSARLCPSWHSQILAQSAHLSSPQKRAIDLYIQNLTEAIEARRAVFTMEFQTHPRSFGPERWTLTSQPSCRAIDLLSGLADCAELPLPPLGHGFVLHLAPRFLPAPAWAHPLIWESRAAGTAQRARLALPLSW